MKGQKNEEKEKTENQVRKGREKKGKFVQRKGSKKEVSKGGRETRNM